MLRTCHVLLKLHSALRSRFPLRRYVCQRDQFGVCSHPAFHAPGRCEGNKHNPSGSLSWVMDRQSRRAPYCVWAHAESVRGVQTSRALPRSPHRHNPGQRWGRAGAAVRPRWRKRGSKTAGCGKWCFPCAAFPGWKRGAPLVGLPQGSAPLRCRVVFRI